ncbi:hypothetical protein QFW77_15950 [Luteimonas sp. RD2P54]|uniref:Dicarboxylate transport domain-containing protein n=1 Tax=Luteimonas endophytica TaxID=3042023 RepID=A0ABT6JE27_9GAMM|nr:hypothetical protein [Luteimonas endophytica]MDH5824468.1 hypothetical protein [Luteimonas endophytica]
MAIPRILLLAALLLASCVQAAQARTMNARIERIDAAVAVLEQVRVRLAWPADAEAGTLRIEAGRVRAPDLGYDFRELAWECPLARTGDGQWRCDGELHGRGGGPLRLAVDLGPANTDAVLSRGRARIALSRSAAAPDLTSLDLARVPLAWAQALVAQAWAGGRLAAGTLDGALAIEVPERGPLRIGGELQVAGAALDSADASVAAEGLGARIGIDYRKLGDTDLVALDGALRGGELLVGNAYVVLPDAPLPVRLEAIREGAGAGWRVPRFEWRDGPTLQASGSVAFAPDLGVRALDIELHSDDASQLPARYLSGWLALSGLAGLELAGGLALDVGMAEARLQSLHARLHGLRVGDGAGRFGFEGLDGDLRFAGDATVDSELRWRAGHLRDIRFGPARLPFRAAAGELRMRAPFEVDVLGGRLRFDGFALRPPDTNEGMRLQFGLAVETLDVARLAESMGWPAFGGTLSGEIPRVRYADQRLDFDGGLAVRVFGGSVAVSALSMERPFGVAPTLSADLELRDLDLLTITRVFEFGSISGRLFGRVDRLRLVDWQLSSFDAELHTERRRGVRQRISQRAVQNISSVGDASFVGSLQDRLIGLFDDFRYARIGISCQLANEVCRMGGLRSAGNAFTIVEGAGLPRLHVVGHNRNVDWPTLVERLAAVAGGDVAPVVE